MQAVLIMRAATDPRTQGSPETDGILLSALAHGDEDDDGAFVFDDDEELDPDEDLEEDDDAEDDDVEPDDDL